MNVSNRFKCFIELFVDDKEIKNVQSIANEELDKIHGWLCTNKLSINITKTNFMVFSKSNKFVIPRIYIELSDNVRFLDTQFHYIRWR